MARWYGILLPPLLPLLLRPWQVAGGHKRNERAHKKGTNAAKAYSNHRCRKQQIVANH